MPLGDRFDTTLAAARAGADWAWRALYLDLAPPLLGYLRSQGAPDPEDLVADVFLQVVRRLETFSGDEDGFRSWVFTVAHHRLIDARRYHGRRPAVPTAGEDLRLHAPAEVEDAADRAMARLSTDQVMRLLDVLTDQQREVLVLRLSGFTIAEVAEIIGRTENATKALQRRGLRALERHLQAGDDPYPSGSRRRSPG